MLNLLKPLIFRTKFWHRFGKNPREIGYWRENADKMVAWYRGEGEFRGFPHPVGNAKENRFEERKNAIMSYIAAETAGATYCRDLCLFPDSFVGKKVVDIGSGPMPTLDVFSGCERYCVDHLIEEFRGLGYPLEEFEPETQFVVSKSEALSFDDDFFDVVISRNALDHVDDFPATCREILRVLKSGGWVHIQIHYHAPTPTEPLSLNDELVLECLGSVGIKKIQELDGVWGFDDGKTVIWSNIPEDKLNR